MQNNPRLKEIEEELKETMQNMNLLYRQIGKQRERIDQLMLEQHKLRQTKAN